MSFVASGLTTVVLVTKFVNQPAAHGSFAYSDTAAAALMSLGLLGRKQWFEFVFNLFVHHVWLGKHVKSLIIETESFKIANLDLTLYSLMAYGGSMGRRKWDASSTRSFTASGSWPLPQGDCNYHSPPPNVNIDMMLDQNF